MNSDFINMESTSITTKLINRFNIKHSLSSTIILAVLSTFLFNNNIDLIYRIGVLFNGCVSFLYNGLQEECPENHETFIGEFSCSYIEHIGQPFLGIDIATYKKIDLFFVCFICLYTALSVYGVPLPIIIMLCLAGAMSQTNDYRWLCIINYINKTKKFKFN